MSDNLYLTNVLQPVLQIGAIVVGAYFTRYAGRALTYLEDKLDLHVTDQQNAMILAAVKSHSGEIETLIDQKVMAVSQVHVANDTVREHAQALIDALPLAGETAGLTVSTVAGMIVGAVDTKSRTAP